MKKNNISSYHMWILLVVVASFLGGCKDEKNSDNEFNPSKAVVISSFSPEQGGIGTRMFLNGENFGTDPSKIKVTVGGVPTKVIGTNGTTMFFMIPGKAFEGTIELTMLDANNQEVTKVIAQDKFDYQRKMLVSTLLGKVDEKGKYEEIDGPFENSGGIRRASWLSFDPKNPNHLYFIGDEGAPFRLIDFDQKYLSTKFGSGTGGLDRMRTITWKLDGDHMIIATDRGGDNDQSNSVLSRSKDFKDVEVLTRSKQCNGSAIHPRNGELYFNSYGMGKVFRYDFDTKQTEELFSIQDRDWEFNIQIHPSGTYAYIVVVNRHYILRTDYDESKKTFTTPYIICGWPDSKGWNDGVGTRVRLSSPYQGAFVKNETYIKGGESDIYDFYFCDRDNQAIRLLTPTGKVSTFAGRGSLGVNSDAHGYIDGDLRLEARFHAPEGLVYDETKKAFYVGDRENHRIRKIAYEEE